MRQEALGEIHQILRGPIVPDPDWRISPFLKHYGTPIHTVVEFGCWTGRHTAMLVTGGFNHVRAVDARPRNVAATLLRLSLLEPLATYQVKVDDVETADPGEDCLCHIGVLYHLQDPIAHLNRILSKVKVLCLGTHINHKGMEQGTYESCGKTYHTGVYREYGWGDELSGLESYSRWLEYTDIMELVDSYGFKRVHLEIETGNQNGSWLQLLVERG